MLTAAATVVIVAGTVVIAATHHAPHATAQPAASATAPTISANPSASPTSTATADPTEAAGSIPTLTADPMDDMSQDVAGLAPATTSTESDAQAIAVAEKYFDTLVDTSIGNVDWRHILEPLTTPEQYKSGVRKIDATWYDGLGTRTAPATIERASGAGLLYVHIATTKDPDIALVLMRPTEADTWRVDGFRG
jgi:hypothetical protein